MATPLEQPLESVGSDDSPDDGHRRGWGPARVATALAVACMVALWGYVLYLAIGPGRQDPPDRLDDPTFAVAAQARCQAALDRVAALPTAASAPTPQARAEVIDQATDVFATMVDDLTRLRPGGEDGRLVGLWLDDWRTYLGDRREHADVLRSGGDRRFQVTARDSEQITLYVDGFAADNAMPACGSPLDL